MCVRKVLTADLYLSFSEFKLSWNESYIEIYRLVTNTVNSFLKQVNNFSSQDITSTSREKQTEGKDSGLYFTSSGNSEN